ncbi:MAG: ThiF family adenylyltransferase [Fimbriimonadaceae bacterium]|nr:ThiF family adenylyltransferase [Fimbriimonadaceae bacterium]
MLCELQHQQSQVVEVSPKLSIENLREESIERARIRLATRYDLRNVLPAATGYVEEWSLHVGLEVTERLIVRIPERFPFELPHLYLDSENHFRTLAHVNRKGRFCYLDETAIAYDYENIGNVCEEVVDRAVEALRNPSKLTEEDEFRKELFAYVAEAGSFLSLLVQSEAVRRVAILHIDTDDSDGPRFLAAENVEAGTRWLKNAGFGAPKFVEAATYVPNAMPGRPPFPQTLFEFDQMVKAYDPAASGVWLKNLRDSRLFLTEVHSSLGPTLVAIRHEHSPFRKGLSQPKRKGFRPGKYPLRLEISVDRRDERVSYYGGDRVDVERLANRTSPELASEGFSRILVVGVGAVGSNLIQGLCSAKLANSVALFDPDKVGSENVLRHTAKFYAVGYAKRVVVDVELSRSFPWIEVRTYGNALDDQNTYVEEASQADLIVLTTGSQSLEKYLGQLAFASAKPGAKIVKAWLETEANKGHVTINMKGLPGCPACWQEVRATQDLDELKREPGCGGSFANYGGSRLQRFVATATDHIWATKEPIHLEWRPRNEETSSTDTVVLAKFAGEGCSECHE